MSKRIEKDTLGKIDVHADRYWAAQTQRSLENFKIGENPMPKEVIYAFAIIKKAAALTNQELNVLSSDKAEIICKVCDEILLNKWDQEFPLSVWQTGSGTHTNMNINEVIANRAHVLLGHTLGHGTLLLSPNDDINKSQSSNDTFSSAMHISAYKMLIEKTIPGIESLKTGLEQKSREFSSIIKVGRTHLMDATPVTLGQELSGHVAQLDFGIKSLKNSLSHLSQIALGATSVGTGINTPKGYSVLVAKKVSDLTKYPFQTAHNKFESIATHDALVESHGALKQIAVSLMKIANDIRMLSSGPRCGLGEIILPANEPGSSIMPGKINPTQCEALTMVCAQVIGNDVAISIGGMSGQFELNTFKPLIIFNFLNSARLIADACVSFNKNCILGIKVDKKRIKKYLESSLMLVTSLNPHIGYDKAAEIANAAHRNETSIREEALKSGHVTAQQFDLWVDPKKMLV